MDINLNYEIINLEIINGQKVINKKGLFVFYVKTIKTKWMNRII